MGTPRLSPRIVPSAAGSSEPNSRTVEDFRRHIQGALPYGAGQRIAERLGRTNRFAWDQLEGTAPLHLTVAVEALSEVRDEIALEATDDLLAPRGLAVIRKPGARHSMPGILAANAGLLKAMAGVETALAEGLADGEFCGKDATAVISALTETRARVQSLIEHFLGGGR